jgi:hypothetical protein
LVYTLEAGAADGIAIGAEFTVYRHTDTTLAEPLAILIVDRLMDFSAEMKPPHDSSLLRNPLIPVLSAVQTKAGELADFRFYISPEDPFYPLYCAKRHLDAEAHNILLVSEGKDTHLKIRTSLPEKFLVFELTDERVTRYGINIIKDDVEPDPQNVSWILERAARYHRELNRTNLERIITTGNFIEVEFFGLDPGPKVHDLNWTAEHLTPTGQNLCHNNTIDFIVEDENKPYGVNIINTTTKDLYLNAFFFDSMNFEIGGSQSHLVLSENAI